MKRIRTVLADCGLPRLEADLLLAHALKVDRAYLIAHADTAIDDTDFVALCQRRLAGEPIAYILEKKAFWQHEFAVNASVLIPRPETELLVDKALSLFAEQEKISLLELGTGSGCIAISIALARPQWQVTAVELSEEALAVAKTNQQQLQCQNVQFQQSDWFSTIPEQSFDLIISNPPYIDALDRHLSQGDLRFEPKSALAAGADGLADLYEIIKTAKSFLKPDGYVLLEHGYQQADAIKQALQDQQYADVVCYQDLANLNRMTVARFKA